MDSTLESVMLFQHYQTTTPYSPAPSPPAAVVREAEPLRPNSDEGVSRDQPEQPETPAHG